MTLLKKVVYLFITSTAVGFGTASIKYLTKINSSVSNKGINELQLKENKRQEKIKKDRDLILKFCKSSCEKTKKVLDDNKDLKFEFRFI